ncbi:hypothetical protein [Halalkalibacter okhensis]|nr:hypothetical protein [Halalkalibacter okhensis]
MDESLRAKILFAVVLLLFISFTTGKFTGNGETFSPDDPASPLLLFD